jgi:hypothetical protein
VAVALGFAVALVAAAAERRFELLLDQVLDEGAHLPAHRLLGRIEPVGAGERRWRRGRG